MPTAETTGPANLTARIEGAFLAAGTGDALGWPQEDRSGIIGGRRNIEPRLAFIDWTRRAGGRYQSHEEHIEAGSYSDDTQLTLALARCLLQGDQWWDVWTQRELPFWPFYERGGGGATLRAAASWGDGRPPWQGKDAKRYFDAGGNGVAMRVLPHAALAAREASFRAAARRIVRDGVSTHGHPRALVGALVFGYVLWRAFRRSAVLDYGELIELTRGAADWKTPSDLIELDGWMEAADRTLRGSYLAQWEVAVTEMEDLLKDAEEGISRGSLAVDRSTMERLGAFTKGVSGAGTVTAASAIFLASRYAAQPAQGLIAAAFAKGADTDTVAAMAGALLGAINGPDWIEPLAHQLEDALYMRELGWRIATGSLDEGQPTRPWQRSTKAQFWREFRNAQPGMDVRLPDGRSGVVTAVVEHTARLDGLDARTWVVKTDDRQTLHLKDVRRQTRSAVDRAVAAPETDQRARIGVVLTVADMDRALSFYRDIIGLRVSKETTSYVTFAGLLVLERGLARPSRGQMQLTLDQHQLVESTLAITVYLTERDFEEVRGRLLKGGYVTTPLLMRDGRKSFRCADPDGNAVEFRERSASG